MPRVSKVDLAFVLFLVFLTCYLAWHLYLAANGLTPPSWP